MLEMSVPWWELVVRATIVYGALLVLLRLTGKRQVGQLAPTDLVLLLVLSNAVQNSMNAGDNSLVGGLVSAVTLVALNYVVNRGTYRSKTVERIIDGSPQILIRHGVVSTKTLASAGISDAELLTVLRQHGCLQPSEVDLAILETNGAVSVLRHETPKGDGSIRRAARRNQRNKAPVPRTTD